MAIVSSHATVSVTCPGSLTNSKSPSSDVLAVAVTESTASSTDSTQKLKKPCPSHFATMKKCSWRPSLSCGMKFFSTTLRSCS